MARETTILGKIGLTNGHEGVWMEDSDPKGSRVVHVVVRTQRECDRLHHRGILDDGQYQAGNRLRDLWEQGTPTHQPVSRNLERPMGEGIEADHNWKAWGDFLDAMLEIRGIGRTYCIITQNVVCFDEPPKTLHLVPLRTALDHLYEFFYCNTR